MSEPENWPQVWGGVAVGPCQDLATLDTSRNAKMRMQQTENQGVVVGGGSYSRDNCHAKEVLAPNRQQIFPVPLYIGTYLLCG